MSTNFRFAAGSEIPSDWRRVTVRKRTLVRMREVAQGGEKFVLSWGTLDATPEEDIVIVTPSEEYPCKRDIFSATYKEVEPGMFQKQETSIIVEIPEGASVELVTKEGELKQVCAPDFIAVGKKDEVYANTADFVANELEIVG